ncbi:MAG: hypothetical protein RLZZ435_3061 [Cyanobacteriota bacterium]|jgi:hypothetical protein
MIQREAQLEQNLINRLTSLGCDPVAISSTSDLHAKKT